MAVTPKFTDVEWHIGPLFVEHGYTDNDGGVPIMAGDDRIGTALLTIHVPRRMAYRVKDPERDANAHLLAASKKLYELARKVAMYFDGVDSPLGDEARAAIASAEGRAAQSPSDAGQVKP